MFATSSVNLFSKLNPKSPIVEGFRALRSNLSFLEKTKANKIYLITSSVSGEGKTFIAANLAITFAKSGKKTLVLGADLRKPKLFTDFFSSNETGLSNYLTANKVISDIITNSEIDNLFW